MAGWAVGLLVLAVTTTAERNRLRREATAQLQVAVRDAEERILGDLQRVEQTLRVIAKTELIQRLDEGCARLVADAHRTIEPLTTGILVTDAEGIVRCGVPARAIGTDLSGLEVRQRVRNSDAVEISPMQPGLITGETLIGVTLGWSPASGGRGLISSGVRVGVLAQPVDWPVPDASVWLVDSRGTSVPLQLPDPAGPAPVVPPDQPTETVREVELDGTRQLLALRRFDDDLSVVAMQPVEALEARAWRQALMALGPAFLALLATTLATLLLVRGAVVRPLRQLAGALGAAPGTEAPDLSRLPRELAELGERILDYRAQVQSREQELQAAVATRTLLLRELSHRTMNNLQIVSSLLALQQRRLGEGEGAAQLGIARERIAALATLHKHLSGSDGIDRVRLDRFLADLADQITRASGGSLPATAAVPARQLEVCVDAPPLPLAMDQATPLGLIVNELLTNSIKYGFPGNRPGQILITATEDQARIELVVSDNGIGAPGDDLPSGGLGASLIQAFIRQLDGSIERRPPASGSGTTVALVFRWKPPEASPAEPPST